MPGEMVFILALHYLSKTFHVMVKIFFLSFLTIANVSDAFSQINSDNIIGRWMSMENNLEVEVFKCGNQYKAIVLWLDDSDDKSRPMNKRCDSKNPVASLRIHKIIGLEVMHGLVYDSDDDEWKNGRIYDSSTGKDWNAKAWLTNDGVLKVRGFWHFEFLGKNISFKRVS